MREGEVYRGIVTEALPATMFRVEDAQGRSYLCSLSGKMYMNHIRVLLNDKVEFVKSPDDVRGRIIKRYT